jgi:hypothetical protein
MNNVTAIESKGYMITIAPISFTLVFYVYTIIDVSIESMIKFENKMKRKQKGNQYNRITRKLRND